MRGGGENSPKKQNVPVDTRTHFSTRASIPLSELMSRDIFSSAKITAFWLPGPFGEEKLQPHDERGAASLLAVDYAGKTVEAALQGPHVDALVGRPLLFRQNGRSVEAHVPSGRDLVGDHVQADQGYRDFQKRAILSPASRPRVHVPPVCRKTRRPSELGGNDRQDCAGTGMAPSIRYSLDSGSGLYRWPMLSDKVNEVGCKEFLCLKKQNVPAGTGTHFSTRPSVSDSKLLSSKILKNRKLFCYSPVFSDIGLSETVLDTSKQLGVWRNWWAFGV